MTTRPALRTADLTRTIRALKTAGAWPARVECRPDGTVIVTPIELGAPAIDDPSSIGAEVNPWDAVLRS